VEQHWTRYTASLLGFSLVSFLFVYVIQRLQGWLPLNPLGMSTGNATALKPDLAFNTAVSFMTNTNWQSYAGEVTLS
jgi:K+-transporting ATPase ATPase A chain